MRTKDGQLVLFHDVSVEKNLEKLTGTQLRFGFRDTWTPKVCRIMAFMAIIRGLGLLFHILLGFRVKGSGNVYNLSY